MTPTREQFKDFITAVQNAQVKEEKLDKAFELIWDDDQGQHTPFYISPLMDAIFKSFNIMFSLEDDKYAGNELAWWLEQAPKNEAIYWIDKEEHNVSDVDAFYDYLVKTSKESEYS